MKPLILYVEDDEYYQFLVKRLIVGTEKYEFQLATTMKGYRHRMSQSTDMRPNLILMDIILPEYEGGPLAKDGGFTLYKERCHGDIPMIFLSVWTKPEHFEAFVNYIGSNINTQLSISKPLSSFELLDTVRKVLEVP